MAKNLDILPLFKKHIKGKTAVFIDAANILYSQKDLKWKIDYLKLKKYGYQITAKEVKFIKLKNNQSLPKGNLDVELALDAYRLKDNYQTLILMSGDSDFAYLLDLIIKEKKQIIVISTRGHISKELLGRGKYIDLPKLKKIIEFVS